MKKTFLASILFLQILSINAQKCGFELVTKHHQSEEKREWVEKQIHDWIGHHSSQLRSGAVITLPVVVHVLYRQPDQNISEEQIRSQIDVLNEDFRGVNENVNRTPPVFQPHVSDVELEFCLVQRDESGEPHSGINRIQVQRRNIGLTEIFYKSDRGGIDPWDPEKYINIYVCELGRDLLGYATVPSEKEEFDGIVVQPQYFGREGSAIQSTPNHLGRTLTHEMGHYLGLEHLWGFEGSSCAAGDFVDDTPEQEEPSYACPTFPLRDICSPGREGLMYMNYMDYTDDDCMTMFTHGQKSRMLAQLDLFRSNLMNNNVCTTTGSDDQDEDLNIWATYNIWTKELCVEAEITDAQIIITDLNGRLALSKSSTLSSITCWNWEPDAKGIYTLQIRKGTNMIFSTIFVAN